MKIESLHMTNFRGIEDAEITFGGQSVILYGINGMGKSTILDACNILFSKILHTAAQDNQIRILMIQEKDVKLGATHAKLLAKLSIGEQQFAYSRSRTEGKNTHNGEQLSKLSECIVDKYLGILASEVEEDEEGTSEGAPTLLLLDDLNMPVYVSYGVNRYIESQRPIRRRYTGEGNRLDAWRDEAFSGVINFNLFFEWFRKRQEYENSVIVEGLGISGMDYAIPLEDAQLSVVRKAILGALGEDFTAIRIRIVDEVPEMMVTKKNCELNVKQLSAGEKSVIALVGDLARRLSIANPGRENPMEGEGIVLIDELDLHLHPLWQSRIMPTLMKIFPNIQFIVTTHAPKVLAAVGDEVRLIRLKENEDHAIAAVPIKPVNGWDVNNILEGYMDTQPMNEDTAQMIENMYHLIHEGQYDKAQELADLLADMTSEENMDVVRARILIARGQ